jgi:DNA-binding MarR family transcriptional regulator
VQRQIDLQHETFPELDYGAKAITGRIIRLSTLFVDGLRRAIAAHGLSPNEYAILTVLRSSGPPFTLPPKEINRALILTSGGITNILNGLERRGLVQRFPDPADGRGVLIRATRSALRIIDAAIAAHLAEEHAMLAPLEEAERAALCGLLSKLLVALDPVV